MRNIDSEMIVRAVAGLCGKAACLLPPDILAGLKRAAVQEESPQGRAIINELLENAGIAASESLPTCQDTGLAVIFIDWGQDVLLTGDSLEDAVNQGVRQGYQEAFLRKSVVSDPLFERKNTGDNTPAVIHLRQVPGDRVKIVLAPKGGGCENKSVLRMLTPADGVAGVRRTVYDAAAAAGASACPPFFIGVGVGGSSELAMLNAKRALLRGLDSSHPDPRYACLEDELLALVNTSGIGPQGFGGRVTALKVNVEFAPAHIASLPVAVSISCHAARHAGVII